MSRSRNRICGGPVACTSSRSISNWKRQYNREFRRKSKLAIAMSLVDEDSVYIPTDVKKNTSDPYGPGDGHTIYTTIVLGRTEKIPNNPNEEFLIYEKYRRK